MPMAASQIPSAVRLYSDLNECFKGRSVIYKATNLVNGKIYIGYDPKWPRRKIAHKTKSKNGSSLYFHAALRKYGFNQFAWTILAADADASLENEKNFIREHSSNIKDIGYNLTEGGEGTSGYRHTLKAREKISKAHVGHPSYTKGMTWKKTPEQCRNSGMAHSKYWLIITPDGSEKIIRNLYDFAKDNNLSKQCLWLVSQGSMTQHKGYKCRRLSHQP